MTPPPSDDDPPAPPPPPPKRRRKPPRGLEGFDTGFPEDAVDADSSGIPRKQIWTESSPAPSKPSPTTIDDDWSAPVSGEPSDVVEPSPSNAAAYGTSQPLSAEDLDRLEPLSALATYSSSASPDAELRDAIGATTDKRALKSGAPSSAGPAPRRAPGASGSPGPSTSSGVPKSGDDGDRRGHPTSYTSATASGGSSSDEASRGGGSTSGVASSGSGGASGDSVGASSGSVGASGGSVGASGGYASGGGGGSTSGYASGDSGGSNSGYASGGDRATSTDPSGGSGPASSGGSAATSGYASGAGGGSPRGYASGGDGGSASTSLHASGGGGSVYASGGSGSPGSTSVYASGGSAGSTSVYASGGSAGSTSVYASGGGAGSTSVYASGGSGGSSGGADGTGDDDDADDSDDDDDDDKPRSRKMIIVSSVSLVVGLGIAALVFLGRANSASYYLACEPDRIVAQQGRSFPPWGESTLEGKQWAAIKIPPEAECIALETESEDELSDRFRTALVKRASVLLTAKEVTKTDEANALLEQALLHTRSTSDASRNARVDIQRLLGDVAYWRASLKMHDASKALLEAAKQFDAAAQQRPRHVTDAAAWAEYVRKVVGDLEAGPGGVPTTFPPMPPASVGSSERPPAPPGVALPVEPDSGSASEPAPTPPDAGIPTGGVLL